MSTFNIGDIVIPKTEWLDVGEEARPAVVVDVWDDLDTSEKMTVVDYEEFQQNLKNPNMIVPKFNTFTKYYEKF